MTTGLAGVGIEAGIYVLIATVGTVIIFMGVTQVWGPKNPEIQERTSDVPEVEEFYDGHREGGKKSRKKIKIKRKTLRLL